MFPDPDYMLNRHFIKGKTSVLFATFYKRYRPAWSLSWSGTAEDLAGDSPGPRAHSCRDGPAADRPGPWTAGGPRGAGYSAGTAEPVTLLPAHPL